MTPVTPLAGPFRHRYKHTHTHSHTLMHRITPMHIHTHTRTHTHTLTHKQTHTCTPAHTEPYNPDRLIGAKACESPERIEYGTGGGGAVGARGVTQCLGGGGCPPSGWQCPPVLHSPNLVLRLLIMSIMLLVITVGTYLQLV